MSNKQKILSNIIDNLLDDPDTEIDENTSLFRDQVLDSLNLIALINYLESEFSIKIAASEVNIDNFDTILAIDAFISSKA